MGQIIATDNKLMKKIDHKINRFYRSPNFDARPNDSISAIIMHYTEINFDESLQRLCDPQAKVSAHYLIDKQGEIFNLVEDQYRAWHAGLSFWHQEKVNDFSIGIEIENNGQEQFTKEQIESVIAVCKILIAKYKIMPLNIVGHSDIAPGRKSDPGLLFPWKYLAQSGVGIMPEINYEEEVNIAHNAKQIDDLTVIERLKERLAIMGYNVSSNEMIDLSLKSFISHYMGVGNFDISYIMYVIDSLISKQVNGNTKRLQ